MIFGFEKLKVWQNAIDLTVTIYKITKEFPKTELYCLTDQLKRACSSVSANIAEGNARQSGKDKMHFFNIAYSSLMETLISSYFSTKIRLHTRKRNLYYPQKY